VALALRARLVRLVLSCAITPQCAGLFCAVSRGELGGENQRRRLGARG
jgi:hypothetical protein